MVRECLGMTVLNHGIACPHKFKTLKTVYSLRESANISSHLWMCHILTYDFIMNVYMYILIVTHAIICF